MKTLVDGIVEKICRIDTTVNTSVVPPTAIIQTLNVTTTSGEQGTRTMLTFIHLRKLYMNGSNFSDRVQSTEIRFQCFLASRWDDSCEQPFVVVKPFKYFLDQGKHVVRCFERERVNFRRSWRKHESNNNCPWWIRCFCSRQ